MQNIKRKLSNDRPGLVRRYDLKRSASRNSTLSVEDKQHNFKAQQSADQSIQVYSKKKSAQKYDRSNSKIGKGLSQLNIAIETKGLFDPDRE